MWLWAQIVQELTSFLHRLASMHKDYAVVLCCLGAKEALSKVLDKHSAQLLLASELRDLVTECEKYAQLYSNLTSSILAGCIQVRKEGLFLSLPLSLSPSLPLPPLFLGSLFDRSSNKSYSLNLTPYGLTKIGRETECSVAS
jgi:hypothetical protein